MSLRGNRTVAILREVRGPRPRRLGALPALDGRSLGGTPRASAPRARYLAAHSSSPLHQVKNKWERRAPLTPRHVRQLVDQDIRVLVQPSGRRVFSDEEYRRAGAEMGEDVSAASLVLGVKEVPPEQLLPNRCGPSRATPRGRQGAHRVRAAP